MLPALLVFAKRPAPGRVKTRLTPPLSHQDAAEIYHCMLCDILEKVSTLSVDVTIFYEDEPEAAAFFSNLATNARILPQIGNDLGERIKNAFSSMFHLGYHSTVVIGTDSPDLPSDFIHEAFQLLGSADAVFGPSEDGGYYLLGLKSLHEELFTDIAWSTESVLRASIDRAAESGLTVKLLPTWYDVDIYVDLKRDGLVTGRNGARRTGEFIRKLKIGV